MTGVLAHYSTDGLVVVVYLAQLVVGFPDHEPARGRDCARHRPGRHRRPAVQAARAVSTVAWIAVIWFVGLFVVPLIGLVIGVLLSRDGK
jgi:hypothetical protein